jgi:G3E family GTPase
MDNDEQSVVEGRRTPINLITGYLGSGKTSAILNLLESRPEGEKWAIIVNEFGNIGIDQEAFEAQDGVQIKPLAGGCVCCTLAGKLTSTLMRLLHLEQVDRILLEVTGLGHPAGIFDALSAPDLARFLDLRATICLMDPRLLEIPRYVGSEVFQDQINMADVLVLNKIDLAPHHLVDEARARGENLFPPKQEIVATSFGIIDPAILDIVSEGRGLSRFPAYHESSPREAEAPLPSPTVEHPVRQIGKAYGQISCGWIFHRDLLFSMEAIEYLTQLEPTERVKGVLRTEKRWLFINRVGSEYNLYELAYRRESRLEIICSEELAWDVIEAHLLGCARVAK